MAKFHLNPETGNPGLCKATTGNCPFALDEDHFASQREAQKAYEKIQERFEEFTRNSKVPQYDSAHTLAVFKGTGDPKFKMEKLHVDFVKAMNAAADGALLVVENGNVWQKDMMMGKSPWVLKSRGYGRNTRISGRGQDSEWLLGPVVAYGGRVEISPAIPVMSPEHRANIYPDNYEISHEASILNTTFTKDDGGGSEASLNETLDDYVVERWSELDHSQRLDIRDRLQDALGTPTNLGDEESPSWIWRK